MNNKVDKSQVLVLFVLALLLVITPFLPSSLKPTYLYFILNILIISLGAEAGLLSAFSKPFEDRKQHVSPVFPVSQKPDMPSEIIPEESGSAASEHGEKKPKNVENFSSEKILRVIKVYKMKKCASMPSLFFIGGGEADTEVMDEEPEAEDEVGGVNAQELFAKAEAFIGNFYKQLKMQREEHMIYQN
ncbi:uncharacterized protein LOC130733090 [Lotus japonicus]|uniref:uncharacterized protein LOC130733090 n=1 Tax=Lotus japonicus TaxID=34305 RepID=UPI00258613AA|nr:uncharacterized protein LOC130733090 [Lotus japonicus]